ncbi:MAG: hypothetical protein HY718_14320 [Planctomycetes bacterium]|nr:hypothetical protein [Planctomycetota bacterium]
MFAQWVSWAFVEQHQKGINESLLTLGRAPLNDSGFLSVVLGQLGEPRLGAAISSDVAGDGSHARALDADTKGPLRDIHRRVGTAILFESSGGQSDKVSHLPELRFALGEPNLDTTSIDNAAVALEKKGYFIRKVGTDGFRFGFQPTLKKVVADRRASLDEEEDILKPMRALVRQEFEHKAVLPLLPLPKDGDEVADVPRLTVVVLDPQMAWDERGEVRETLVAWTRRRGSSDRSYPAALIWCVRKAGKDLRDRVMHWQAWKKVKQEIDDGVLLGEFEPADRAKVGTELSEASGAAADEVWASYRFVLIADPAEPSGLKLIDLGAGHSSGGQSLTGRIVVALRSEGRLNESVGAGYIERNWPPALKESGTWPLSGMRQAFLNGALTRLLDPDAVLRTKIAEFVQKGDFGLASNQRPDGTFERVWFNQPIGLDEITFDAQVFLLTKKRAQAALAKPAPAPETQEKPIDRGTRAEPDEAVTIGTAPPPAEATGPAAPAMVRIRLRGTIAPEVWNKLGVRLLPRLRAGQNLSLGLDVSCDLPRAEASTAEAELRQAIADLRLSDSLSITRD